jgi:diaminohydroxyphosphoribosylaminopyrimidine deaminase/5-amino-6-(5-phosphoribosylamino)uracil reductase
MFLKEAMKQAMLAARSVEGRTSPRPPVGAVLVRHGQIVGRGATAPPYGPHAEVQALSEAGSAARDADLYVTLEPCCTTMHTPVLATWVICSEQEAHWREWMPPPLTSLCTEEQGMGRATLR